MFVTEESSEETDLTHSEGTDESSSEEQSSTSNAQTSPEESFASIEVSGTPTSTPSEDTQTESPDLSTQTSPSGVDVTPSVESARVGRVDIVGATSIFEDKTEPPVIPLQSWRNNAETITGETAHSKGIGAEQDHCPRWLNSSYKAEGTS
jgi:hypothetical protein